MDAATLALLGVGGFALTQGEQRPEASPPPRITQNFGKAVKGRVVATGSQLLKPNTALSVKKPTNEKFAHKVTGKNPWWTVPGGIGAQGSNPGGTFTRAQIDKAEELAKAEYNKLSHEAKCAGAELVNAELKVDPPISCDDSYEEIAAIIGASLGAAGGVAACAPIGMSAICGPLGAIVGKYLGKEFYQFMDEHWDDIQGWFEDKYNDAKGGIVDASESIYDNTIGRIF